METMKVMLAIGLAVLGAVAASCAAPAQFKSPSAPWRPPSAMCVKRQVLRWPRTLPPGIYETAPYSCIVVVPGPHADDRCVLVPSSRGFPTPVIRPGLQFIPRIPRK